MTAVGAQASVIREPDCRSSHALSTEQPVERDAGPPMIRRPRSVLCRSCYEVQSANAVIFTVSLPLPPTVTTAVPVQALVPLGAEIDTAPREVLP